MAPGFVFFAFQLPSTAPVPVAPGASRPTPLEHAARPPGYAPSFSRPAYTGCFWPKVGNRDALALPVVVLWFVRNLAL